MSKSSLSSVVSNLVRASMGSSVPNTVPDDDLDRHVAELILKEAKQKAEKYAKEGIRAYLPQPESNAPKTNKRFLSSIIRNTDDHNKTILRAQALAAEEARLERLEQEKKERRARAEEAVEAERLRRLMSGSVRSRHRDRDERKDRKRRERSWERRSEEVDDRDTRKGKGRMDDRDDSKDRHRRHRRSRSPRRDDDSDRRSRRHREHKERSRYRSLSPPDNGSVDEEERYRDRRRRERHSWHESRRSRSPGRRHGASSDDEHERDRKRRRRSRLPSVALSEDEKSHRESRTHRSRHHKRRRTPSPAPSEGSVTASDSRLRYQKEDTRVVDTQDTIHVEDEPSRPLSPSLLHENTQCDTSSKPTTPNAPADSKMSPASAEPVQSTHTPKPPSPMRIQSLSPGESPRSWEKSTAGPSSSRHVSRPRDPSPSPGPPLPSPSPPPPTKSKSKPSRHRSRTSKAAPPPPSSAPPPLPAHLPSKMDKYFEESYDPRLDIASLAAPSIPATGLINDAEFAGWDAMLELIRQRREDKEERKRLERWGVGKDKDKDKDKDLAKKNAGASTDTVDIMSIEYKKRGAVREWDMGKEGF